MKPESYSTEELADIAKVKADTLRAALCRDGHWCGLRPVKLPNRRLLWPAAEVDALLQKGSATQGAAH